MFDEYHRPKNLREALILLARKQPESYPLGGGTVLNRGINRHIAVIDLQALELNSIVKKGNSLHIGATVTLQQLFDYQKLPEELHKGIQLEATYNLRQMATIAGTLVTADGLSPFAICMLAADAGLEIQMLGETPKQVKLGDWFPLRREIMPGRLITQVILPLNVQIEYEYIARTPADLPIVCAAAAQWDSGRTRLALGGWGAAPMLVMDGPAADGLEIAARSAYSQAVDARASAQYRQEMAGVLADRCLKRLLSRHL